MIAQFFVIKSIVSHSGTDGGNDGFNLFVRENFIQARFFHIQDFSLQGKDGLEASVAALFSRATGGIALHQIYFALCGIVNTAIGKFTGQGSVFQSVLAPGQLPGFPSRFPALCRLNILLDNLLPHRRILLQKLR